MAPLGVYVHVPFCATTCDFCAFYQTVPKGDAVRQYLDGVETEAGLVNWTHSTDSTGSPQAGSGPAGGRPVATAFWGGGTPGLLRPAEIERLGRTMLGFDDLNRREVNFRQIFDSAIPGTSVGRSG